MRVKTPVSDMDSRDRLVMEHVPLVKTLAQRMARRLPPQVEMSDLVSVGVLGLIDAANRYRPSPSNSTNSDSLASSGAYTMKPSMLPASSTGQWRECCGSSGRDDSRFGGRPVPGRLVLGKVRTSMSVS